MNIKMLSIPLLMKVLLLVLILSFTYITLHTGMSITENYAFADSTSESVEQEVQQNVSIAIPILCIGLFSLFISVITLKFFRDQLWLHQSSSRWNAILLASFLIALLLRLCLGYFNEGYANDIALFQYWSQQVYSLGISNFYQGDFFVDYPPGYLYILYVIGAVQALFSIDNGTGWSLVLYKLPAIIADLIAAFYLYSYSIKRQSKGIALGLALLYLFNPAVLLDSAVWGQVDSIFALILVVSITSFVDGKIKQGSIWFGLAALIKPQAFIFMPVVLLALLFKRRWSLVAQSALYGFGTFLILALPFFIKGEGIAGLIGLYKETLSSYPYATLNAFNWYALAGLNWTPVTDVFALIPIKSWGIIGIGLAVIGALLVSFIGKKYVHEQRLYAVAIILIAVVFMTVTKMHERYMFPILLLTLFAFIQHSDRRLLHVFYGFTITNFINVSYVLDHSSFTTFVPTTGVAIVCSIANIGLVIYLLYIFYELFVKGHVQPLHTWKEQDKLTYNEKQIQSLLEGSSSLDSIKEKEKHQQRKWSRQDWVAMLSITVVYGIVALIQLGSFDAPKTVWHPDKRDQGFIIDLGDVRSINKIVYFGGVGTGKFNYEFAVEATEWNSKIEVNSDHTAVFRWNVQDVNVDARYIRLQVDNSGFSMHEMAIYEAGSNEQLTISSISPVGDSNYRRGQLSHLFDEQSLAFYYKDFMKGSYFDEIYHARTAYEHIEGIVAYENTHPPLGKIIIALGIQLFGFHPFGWRITGTLLGVLMLPIMYATAKYMFRRSTYATMATVLFAVDFMHFTQTRIATIDVHGVFFIMLMFYFMTRYSSMNFYRDKLWRTFVPLGLAGLCFGLGVASKWIVLYGGSGLAFMLAVVLWFRYSEYRSATYLLKHENKLSNERVQILNKIKSRFFVNSVLTLLVCVPFYIVIPAAIYALSYIPVLTVMKSGYTFKALIDYQVNMFSYHSNLVANHPFASSWWEWPFMKRPVWYYSGDGLAEGLKSTIVAMGNPIIWWVGIFTLLLTIVISLKRKDRHIYMIFIAYLSQYIPWMLVPRETFLYHYFAMVPFMILSIVYLAQIAEERWKWAYRIRKIYIVVAVVLFIIFYPALSGLTVPSDYINFLLRWFPSWLF